MIYFASDPHGGENTEGIRRFLELSQPSDLLILLGDVGLRFQDTEENRRFDEWFLSLDRQIAMVDGNHENNAYLASFPEDTWGGAPVHRLSPHIVHLKRGNVYTVEGKTFFVMGGCKSSARWKEMGLWYEGEEPSEEELALGYRSLAARNNQVDYILTHRYVDYRQEPEGSCPPLTLEGLTRYIDENVTFRHWYAGHNHVPARPDDRHTIVYDVPIPLT